MKGFKRVLLVLISICMILGLTGCMDAQVDVTINGDGSADQSLSFLVDRDNYDEEKLNDYIEKLKAFKFVVNTEDYGGEIAVSAKVYLPRFRSIINPMTFVDEKFEKIPIEYNSGWFYTEYVFDFDYNVKEKKEFLSELGLEGSDESNLIFTVRVPNEAVETNADSFDQEKKRYLWKLSDTESENIYLKVRTRNNINWAISLGFPILLAIGVFNAKKENEK